jgi:hypothetical protein
MEPKNGETPRQLSLFPETGMEGRWLDYPYAWTDLDAEYLRFCAEFLRKGNQSLLGTYFWPSERD